ncbi:hypothetical protein ACE1AQ_10550, partial [Microcystis sp. BLCC-F209]
LIIISSFSSQVFEYLYLAISRAFRVFILSGLLNFLCPSLCVFQPAECGLYHFRKLAQTANLSSNDNGDE